MMHLAQTEVYEVATFYHHFDVEKEGEKAPPSLTVRVCESLSCQMAGADGLLSSLPALLGDSVRVKGAPCIGRCSEAPAVCVGQNAFGPATLDSIVEAVNAPEGRAAPALAEAIDYARYRQHGGYRLAAELAAGGHPRLGDREAVYAELEHAHLRGLGGAGFPAGKKWRIVAGEAAPRLFAINIDEGEPGTFKDRVYLERDPHRFFEGMLIAAWAVNVESIIIYLRDEYHSVRALLERELAALKADPPAGIRLPPIELRRGAGAYICGEESAMIESIEGKRGMPRLRPPYLAQVGLFGRPTLEHNMETLYWVRQILEQGSAWFAGHGRRERHGLRSFSVSGRIRKPGVHIAPAGISLIELIEEHCGGMQDGHTLYGYLPGGASGGILPASMADLPLDFDTLQPHGCFIGSAAVIVLSDADRATDAALSMMRFFRDESCGQCTPCRSGTAKAVDLMEAPRWDVPLLEELNRVMIDASICGLGQAAPNPVRCVVRYFPDELKGQP
jgi:formate dehydrogenase